MTDMIERVARAMWAQNVALSRHLFSPSFPIETHDFDADIGIREHWLGVARAAIEAMREPTEAMVAAMGSDLTDEGEPRAGTQASLELARAHWRKGIDAAINPPTGSK